MIIIKKAILVWYVFLLLLSVVASVDVGYFNFFPALFFTGIIYAAFYYDFGLVSPEIIRTDFQKLMPKISPYLLVILMLILSTYASVFYTGIDIDSMLDAFNMEKSLYNQYQNYFVDAGLDAFSLEKVPAIASTALMKFFLLYVYISRIAFLNSFRWSSVVYVMVVSFIYLLFSAARGTTFEMFELLVLLVFSLLLHSHIHKKNISLSVKIIVSMVAVIALGLYSYNISARYGFVQSTDCGVREFCLDQSSVLYSISPDLGYLSYQLSGYFLFGSFYLSNLFFALADTSVSVFLATFIPGLLFLLDMQIELEICNRLIDCGVMWRPDFAVLIYNFGILGMLGIVFIVKRFSRVVYFSIVRDGAISSVIIMFYFFLFIISLPVGSFVTNSSANLLNLSVAIAIFVYRKFSA